MPGRVVAPRLDDFVEEMLASLHSYSQVVDHAMAKFGCDERTVTRAIARVREKWKQVEANTVVERRARFRAELEHAWRCALKAGDYRAIAVMARTRADIEGIKAPKEMKHTGTIHHRPVAAMSPQERQRELEILLAKRQADLGGNPTAVIPALAAMPAATADELELVELPPDIRPAKPRGGKRRRRGRVH
jgi:hypothetical protein